MEFHEPSGYGFVGFDRPSTITTPSVISNMVKAAARRLFNQCALQASLTDSTATWQGGLMAMALTVVSVIAVASSRKDLDEAMMRMLRVQTKDDSPVSGGQVEQCIIAKLLSLAIGGASIVVPPLPKS